MQARGKSTTRKNLRLIKSFVKEKNGDVVVSLEAATPHQGTTNSPLSEAIKKSVKFAFGREPVFIGGAGSIGAVISMEKVLKCPVTFLGLSLPEHGYHAPNENFDWQQASGGIVAFAKYFESISQINRAEMKRGRRIAVNKNLSLNEPNVLNIGIDASAPLPLHSDPNLPDFEGFEVDLMKSVASRLGVQVSYTAALWSKLLDYLVEARVDVICTASTITKERKEIFDFGQPYLDMKLAIVTRKESSIETLADLRDRIVGVRIATSAEDFVRGNAQPKSIRTFHMNTEVYKTLQEGAVDAVIDDSPIAQSFAGSTPGLKLAETIPGTEAQYAMMFRKGNDELRMAINDVLTKIEADGTYQKIYGKWFVENSLPIRAA